MFYGVPITPEMLVDIAKAGNPEIAERIARREKIALPEPLTFDCSREEFAAWMGEVEERLLKS